jgi:hypothetical protein
MRPLARSLLAFIFALGGAASGCGARSSLLQGDASGGAGGAGGGGQDGCSYKSYNEYNVSATATALTTADLDGDGRSDIVFAGTYQEGGQQKGVVGALLQDEGGTFAPPAAFTPVGPSPVAIDAADFTADGAPEIVVIDGSSDIVKVLVHQGKGAFATAAEVGTPGRARSRGHASPAR